MIRKIEIEVSTWGLQIAVAGEKIVFKILKNLKPEILKKRESPHFVFIK
jgi:hypothetical protein